MIHKTSKDDQEKENITLQAQDLNSQPLIELCLNPTAVQANSIQSIQDNEQIHSVEQLKLTSDCKRPSVQISNTRKIQILKQLHQMESKEIYEICLQILQKSTLERNHFDIQILQKTLSSIQFFQNFEEQSGQAALLNLFKKLQLETYDTYDLVIQQATKGDKFYIIIQGSVGIFIKKVVAIQPEEMQESKVSQVTTNRFSKSNNKLKKINSFMTPNSPQSVLLNNQLQAQINTPSMTHTNQAPSQANFSQQSQINSLRNINTNTNTRNLLSPSSNSQSRTDYKQFEFTPNFLNYEDQRATRKRSSSSSIDNTSLKWDSISNIPSDSILEYQKPQSSMNLDQNQKKNKKKKQMKKTSIKYQNASIGQISSKLSVNFQNEKEQQIVNRSRNSSNQSNQLDQQEIDYNILQNQFEDFQNNQQSDTRKSKVFKDSLSVISQESPLSIPKRYESRERQESLKLNLDQIQNSMTASNAKSALKSSDNQQFTFLNNVQQKYGKDIQIFPPQEQKFWQKVNELGIGQSFGELALINDAPRLANVVCNSVCHFAVLSKKDFREVVAGVESQKIKGYMQFLQAIPGFDKLSRRALNMIVFCLEIKTYKFRDLIFKEKQKADHLYIVKKGEFILQQTVDYKPPKDPAFYNYEEFNQKFIPAINNKAVRKAQIAVLGSGELFGDYEVFAEIPRSMDAVCNSQIGEVFSIPFQSLQTRCEILNDRDILANLKQNSQQKQNIHQSMLKYIHTKSSSFQNILINNQKLIADQKNTERIHSNSQNSQRQSKNNLLTSQNMTNASLNHTQSKSQFQSNQLRDSLYEPAFQQPNLQPQQRGMSAPSSSRQRISQKTQQYNNLIDNLNNSYKLDFQANTQRSSMINSNIYTDKFSDQVQETQELVQQKKSMKEKLQIKERSSILYSLRKSTMKIEGNQIDDNQQIIQNDSRRSSRQVPHLNISQIKPQTPLKQNTNRTQSSERSYNALSVSSRNRYNNNLSYQGDKQLIQIQDQSIFDSPKKQNCDIQTNQKEIINIRKNSQRKQTMSNQLSKSMIDSKQDLNKSVVQKIKNQNYDDISSSTTLNNDIPITSVVRKKLVLVNNEQQQFEKALKSESMIKAKKMILNQLNNQVLKQNKELSKAFEIQHQFSETQTSKEPIKINKAVDQSFKPNLAFSKLQINPHVDYYETRKQVLRKMRKFKYVNYLHEQKKKKQSAEAENQKKLETKIQDLKNKGVVVINPHAFINFVNIE